MVLFMKEHGEEILNKVKENNNGLMVLNIKDGLLIAKQSHPTISQ